MCAAGSDVPSLDPTPQDTAARIDREADALLQLGFHSQAERLAHRAEALRTLGGGGGVMANEHHPGTLPDVRRLFLSS
jgi:hypothetical protein